MELKAHLHSTPYIKKMSMVCYIYVTKCVSIRCKRCNHKGLTDMSSDILVNQGYCNSNNFQVFSMV